MSITRSLKRLLIALMMVLCLPALAQDQDDPGKAMLQELAEASPRQTEAVIQKIASSGDPRARGWLEAFGNNRLSQYKDSGEVVVVLNNRGRDWTVANPLTGDTIGEVSRRELDRININNAIRSQLEGVLAMLDLYTDDVDRREEAAESLLGKVEQPLVEP